MLTGLATSFVHARTVDVGLPSRPVLFLPMFDYKYLSITFSENSVELKQFGTACVELMLLTVGLSIANEIARYDQGE